MSSESYRKLLRIFVASPGDVAEERVRLKKVVDGLNQPKKLADRLGLRLQLLDWHVPPGMGRPQGVILEQRPVEEWDIFIGILWSRFGTPSGEVDAQTGLAYDSGTHEEFMQAYRAWQKTGRPRILFYRCNREIAPDQIDPEQLAKVQAFWKEFQAEGEHPGLLQEYDTPDAFEDQVRSDLEELLFEYGEQVIRLESKQRLLVAPGEPYVDAGALLEAYLGRLMEQTRWLQLSEVDPEAATDAEKARLALSKVYIPLDALRLEREEKMHRLSAIAALDRYERLVILGDPGSGKSTFVNFVALCMAGEWLGYEEANLFRLGEEWTHRWLLPVKIVLRDFAARGLPEDATERITGDHLWRFVVGELGKTLAGCDAVLRKQLLEQGGLVLLDALDEVPDVEHRRQQVRDAIVDFAANFGRCRFLVTSRTYAYQKQDWRLPDFRVVLLAPFNQGQIESFIDCWYAHMAAMRVDLSPEQARGRAEVMKEAISTTRGLQELASRPLLLTLMASLHACRGVSLPKEREKVYANSVDLLLDVWEQGKIVRDAQGNPMATQPSVQEWLKTPQAKVRAVLDELACEAHQSQLALEGTAGISEGRLVTVLHDAIEDPDLRPKRVVEYVRDRAGVLTSEDVGVYAFSHRAFQEYLASCHLTTDQGGFPDELVRRVWEEPERWREVALLAAAQTASDAVYATWAVIDALCPEVLPEVPAVNAAWAGLIAAQALVEVGLHERVGLQHRPKLDRLRGRLLQAIETEALPPVDRAIAGRALALMGDPRFRAEAWYLPNQPLLGFVEIPAGPFVMGTQEEGIPGLMEEYGDHQQWYEAETPQHELNLPTFYIARYPVTREQFQAFLEESGYRLENPDSLRGLANHPVVWVSWHEALQYCQWLTERLREWEGTPEPLATLLRKDGWAVTLPSEAQWEKAARGTDGRIYPWGNEFEAAKCNVRDTGIGTTTAVGLFPAAASPCGVQDMAGNVWEWTRTLWGEDWERPSFDYPYDPSDGREDPDTLDNVLRVLRGGSWKHFFDSAYCAFRSCDLPGHRSDDIGFRVAVSPILF